MMTPMPIPTPPMMCSLLLNTSSIAAGQLWHHKGGENLETGQRLGGGGQQQQQQQQKAGCVRPARYRGDEDLQPLLFRADVFGRVNHRPCWAAAVQLQPESPISHNISSSRDKEVNLWLPNERGSCDEKSQSLTKGPFIK